MTDITEQLRALEKRIAFLEKLERPAMACRVYNSGNFTHNSTGNDLAITFDSERWDAYGMHSTTSNQSRITVTIGGWYLMTGCAVFDNDATGYRRLGIRLGGATILVSKRVTTPSAASTEHIAVATLYYLAATNYVELIAYQSSGGNLDIVAAANYSPEMSVMRLA